MFFSVIKETEKYVFFKRQKRRKKTRITFFIVGKKKTLSKDKPFSFPSRSWGSSCA